MSLCSVRLEKDCHLRCKCICKSHHELSRPSLLAICAVEEHVTLSDEETLSTPRTLGVYDNGFLLLADDREVQSCRLVYEDLTCQIPHVTKFSGTIARKHKK